MTGDTGPSGSQPPKKYAPTVEDDDDDDVDDLDDVLASFKPAPKAADSQPSSLSKPTQASDNDAEDGEEFDAALMEGMESLLRQLAGDEPSKGETKGKAKAGISQEDEEAAWQKAIEMMLAGGDGSATPSSAPPAVQSQARASGEQPTFEETIKRTMESLKAGGAGAAKAGGGEADLEALLKKLGQDPSALDGLDGDDDLGGILDGMMGQLMTKEILEEPMSELESKYPAYLASPPESTPAADLEKYRQQHNLVRQILATFRKPGYSDDKDGKEIGRLVGEMQDLGGPPQEIMGELPEGFDLGALGGEEGCTIM